MGRHPCAPGKPRKEQHRIGRAELLATSFETFERNIRDQLARILGGGGFDPARDIAAITVNRWPHGYAYTYNSLTDPLEWVFTSSNDRPCVVARQPFGSITIANSMRRRARIPMPRSSKRIARSAKCWSGGRIRS